MITPPATIAKAALSPEELARRAINNPHVLKDVIAGLNAEAARIKYGCARALRQISEERPDVLYPHFEFFVSLLDHRNKIFQWEGALVLAELASVDVENKFAPVFDQYFSPVCGPVLITAANVIRGGARVALAKPDLADRISAEVLKVARARYQTPECRNVAAGHAIVALSQFVHLVHTQAPVLRFVRRQLRNSRPATRRKAQEFLKKFH